MCKNGTGNVIKTGKQATPHPAIHRLVAVAFDLQKRGKNPHQWHYFLGYIHLYFIEYLGNFRFPFEFVIPRLHGRDDDPKTRYW